MTTLVINDDASYCAACGRGALPEELAHVTVLGIDVKPGESGCGAVFDSVATDFPVYPALVAQIAALRPDLPFIGHHQEPGRA
jgi:hypothetical protein